MEIMGDAARKAPDPAELDIDQQLGAFASEVSQSGAQKACAHRHNTKTPTKQPAPTTTAPTSTPEKVLPATTVPTPTPEEVLATPTPEKVPPPKAKARKLTPVKQPAPSAKSVPVASDTDEFAGCGGRMTISMCLDRTEWCVVLPGGKRQHIITVSRSQCAYHAFLVASAARIASEDASMTPQDAKEFVKVQLKQLQ
jgi:hypothetical protein